MPKPQKLKTEFTNSNTEQNVCVTCSTKGECENVFILTFEDTRFSKIFNSCMGFQLSENSSLKYMCLQCIDVIISFHTFKETALKSYKELCKVETASKVETSSDVETSSKVESTEKSEHFVFVNIDDPNLVDCMEAESDTAIELEIDIKKELTEKFKEEVGNPLDKSDKESSSKDEIKLLSNEELKKRNVWQCSYCNIVISKDNPAGIKKHRDRHCKESGSTKIRQTVVSDEYLLLCCQHCDFKINSEDKFRKHSARHKGNDVFEMPPKYFGCTKCEYTSHRKRDVQRHVLAHLKEDEIQMIPCTECDFTTRYISSLYKHIRRRHKNGGEKYTLEKMYKCENCEFSTAYKNSLVSHQLQHKNPVEQEFYYCYLCAFRTIHKANLRSHVKIHLTQEDQRKFVCEICGFSTNYQKTRKSHMLTHLTEKANSNETGKEGQNLKRKRTRVPSSNKLKNRDMAKEGQTLKRKRPKENSIQAAERKRRRRQALIAGGVTLECDQCSYKTVYPRSLRVHKIRHKPDNEVTLYYCDKCTYRSRSKNTLKGHLITHADPETVKTYQCEYCAYRTAYASALRMHLRRHVPTMENTFFCDQCDFKTIYRPNFVAHQSLHKDPRDVVKFSCMWCDYQSVFQSNVSKHELSHHGKKRIRREWTVKKNDNIF